jgi:hypothetical protein
MFDFEKKFKKSVALMVILHVLITFIVIFIVEGHIPREKKSLAQSFAVRSSLDFIIRCVSPLGEIMEKNCKDEWSDKIEIFSQAAIENGIKGLNLRKLRDLNYSDFRGDHKLHEDSKKLLSEIASICDRELAHKDAYYDRSVAGAGWIIGILSLGFLVFLSIFYTSLQEYLLIPMSELTRTIAEWNGGNRLRRCQKKGDGKDFKVLMESVNDILDGHLLQGKNNRIQQKK